MSKIKDDETDKIWLKIILIGWFVSLGQAICLGTRLAESWRILTPADEVSIHPRAILGLWLESFSLMAGILVARDFAKNRMGWRFIFAIIAGVIVWVLLGAFGFELINKTYPGWLSIGI